MQVGVGLEIGYHHPFGFWLILYTMASTGYLARECPHLSTIECGRQWKAEEGLHLNGLVIELHPWTHSAWSSTWKERVPPWTYRHQPCVFDLVPNHLVVCMSPGWLAGLTDYSMRSHETHNSSSPSPVQQPYRVSGGPSDGKM